MTTEIMSRENTYNILHFTDLHFGDNRQPGSIDILESLHSFLETFKKEKEYAKWKPKYVVVSGDIAFDATKEDHYKQASTFFCSISKSLDIPKTSFLFCPGNHDAHQETIYNMLNAYDASLGEDSIADQIFKNRELATLSMDGFGRYASFCKDFYGDQHEKCYPLFSIDTSKDLPCSEFTTGIRVIGKLIFVIINTAWFSIDHWSKKHPLKNRNTDYGYLFAGNSYINNCKRHLKRKFPDFDAVRNDYVVITLMHHGFNWLHWTERYNNHTEDYIPTQKLITELSDIVLNGHEHGEIHPPVLINNALIFTGGATYTTTNSSKSFIKTNFSILKINHTGQYVQRLLFKYKPDPGRWIWEYEHPIEQKAENSESVKHYLGRTIRQASYPPDTRVQVSAKTLEETFNSVAISESNEIDSNKIIDRLFQTLYEDFPQKEKNEMGFRIPGKDGRDVIIREFNPENQNALIQYLKVKGRLNKNIDLIVYDLTAYALPFDDALSGRKKLRENFSNWIKNLESELPELSISTKFRARLEFLDNKFLQNHDM